MTKPNGSARQNKLRSAAAQRTSEVARLATEIQRRERCTRTEALRIVERMVPHV